MWAPNGGFGDLDQNNEYIATGKADIIAMARPLISDWEYGKKAYEGRGEDVVPCLMCKQMPRVEISALDYRLFREP